jgi:phytanoyl-CoA hydroxylase
MLTPEQHRFYDEQGYLPLGKTLSDDELHALQARIDDIMLGRVVYDGMFFQLDSDTGDYGDLKSAGYVGPTLNYRKIQDIERDPLFLAFMQKPLFRELARRYVGENVSCFRAMFMNKPAHKGTILPYHQDGGSQWHLDREKFFTVWTALDPSTRANGCVQIIPGSHKLGLLSERGHTITPEQEAMYCREEDSVYLEAEPGESFLLHNYVLHRSGTNPSGQSRRAFSVVYMDAETRSVPEGRTFPVIFGEGALVPA